MLTLLKSVCTLIFTSLISTHILASTSIKVLDTDGRALSNIVIELNLVGESTSSASSSSMQNTILRHKIEQKDQQFAPHISLVAVNTEITFPNVDTVQHHVYSFSPAKTFEVSLREEFTSAPIKFEKPGIVELGCNIHDWMLAYIYVSDAQWYGQTGDNALAKFDLPSGTYEVTLWHPRLDDADLTATQQVSIPSTNNEIVLTLKKELLPSLTGYDSVEAVDAY
jgi:plastocyanin